jgi:hypothetical protein
MFKNEKTHIDIIITALLGLAGCAGETIEDLKKEEKLARPASRNMFYPPNGVLSELHNLLFTGTQDVILDMPDNFAASGNGGNGGKSIMLTRLLPMFHLRPFPREILFIWH